MIARRTLDNGVRIVLEQVPHVRSVATGIWVGVGSRDETQGVYGTSHFLEHLLFKGTDTRSAIDIAQAFDEIGGEFNAFTSKEQTAFYVRTLDEDALLGLDVLADITQRPAFRPEDIESERRVVLEEIAMHEDSPDEVVHELFSEVMFAGHPLGRSILGPPSSIEALSDSSIAAYHRAHYRPDTIVVAAAGNLDPEVFFKEVETRWSTFAMPPSPAAERLPGRLEAISARRVESRESEQVHLIVGTQTIGHGDPLRHALALLNHVFGGGMSSRLFQEVRERRGLVYSVYSFRSLFEDFGQLGVYAGTVPDHAPETLDVIQSEFDRLGAGISRDELEAARNSLKGALALSQEDTFSRMSRLGRSELALREAPTMDELVARLEAVTLDETNELARNLAGAPMTTVAIGPVDGVLN